MHRAPGPYLSAVCRKKGAFCCHVPLRDCSLDQSRGPIQPLPKWKHFQKRITSAVAPNISTTHRQDTSPAEAARGELLVRDPVVERRAEGMLVGFHDVNLRTANAADAHGIAVVVLAISLLFHVCH